MFELIVLIVFCALFFNVVKLAVKVTWGVAKVVATILFVLAAPMLVVCLIFAGGLALLVPVALVLAAFGILKACI